MAIPFVDLKRQSEAIEKEVLEAIAGVSRSGRYVLGPQLEQFEREVAGFLGVSHAVGVASGTEAIYLALKALGVSPGDEVITTPFSFIAGVEAILALKAIPVFSDIDPQNFNLDPTQIEKEITSKTKAVLVVHLFGNPANLGALQKLCQEKKLFLIEDACQAFGSRFEGKRVGTFGDLGCFSFYPTKILGGMGDSGMVVTSREDLAVKIKKFRNHGCLDGDDPHFLGWNSRLDEIQAAVLRIKLRHVDPWNRERRRLAGLYQEQLSDCRVKLPQTIPNGEGCFQSYTICSDLRDSIREALSAQEIDSMIYYPKPIYQIPAVREALSDLPRVLPKTESACREVLSLPLYPGLHEGELTEVCQVIREVAK